GDAAPVRCLKQGLWVLDAPGGRCLLLLSPTGEMRHRDSMRCQVASLPSPEAAAAADRILGALEKAVSDAKSYRGKVLSLEGPSFGYGGLSVGIRVHRLRPVSRDEVILPARTLDLLDRNVLDFVARRAALAAVGQPTKKGLLFHGPPGTGKT